MGKIVGSYLLKVHVHDDDVPEGLKGTTVGESQVVEAPTLEAVKEAVIKGVGDATGATVTVSLAERTDD